MLPGAANAHAGFGLKTRAGPFHARVGREVGLDVELQVAQERRGGARRADRLARRPPPFPWVGGPATFSCPPPLSALRLSNVSRLASKTRSPVMRLSPAGKS